MTKNKKICFLTINENVNNLFLSEHVKSLSKFYNIEFISSHNKKSTILNETKYSNHFTNINRNLNIFNLIRNLIEIFFIIKVNRFSLLISIHPKNGLIISILKYFLNFKSLHIITGQIWANSSGIKRIILKYIDKFVITKSDYLLTDSKSQINYLNINGFDTKKIKTILNGSICGVNITSYYKSQTNKLNYLNKYFHNKKSKTIIYAGRINLDKGILILLDAFNELKSHYNYDINLLLVGDDEVNISTFLARYPLTTRKNIKILKFKHNINYYYSLSDIFCLPSYREGFGLSVIQASASLLPVIVSNIYGLKDCVKNNYTGLAFDNSNYKNLVFKIKYLLDNPSKIIEFGRNGRHFVKINFNQKEVVTFLTNFIHKII